MHRIGSVAAAAIAVFAVVIAPVLPLRVTGDAASWLPAEKCSTHREHPCYS